MVSTPPWDPWMPLSLLHHRSPPPLPQPRRATTTYHGRRRSSLPLHTRAAAREHSSDTPSSRSTPGGSFGSRILRRSANLKEDAAHPPLTPTMGQPRSRRMHSENLSTEPVRYSTTRAIPRDGVLWRQTPFVAQRRRATGQGIMTKPIIVRPRTIQQKQTSKCRGLLRRLMSGERQREGDERRNKLPCCSSESAAISAAPAFPRLTLLLYGVLRTPSKQVNKRRRLTLTMRETGLEPRANQGANPSRISSQASSSQVSDNMTPRSSLTASEPTATMLIGPKQQRFKVNKRLLCAASPFFRERLDDNSHSKPVSIWLPGESASMFAIFVEWVHLGGRQFRPHLENAVLAARDAGEQASQEIHWAILRLHLFASHLSLHVLQDLAMDAVQDLYLRFDWDVSPSLITYLYTQCEALAAVPPPHTLPSPTNFQ
ncbi:hypothetical protein G7046_g9965 [Stylonectria norvegica]|nr:hypothetical protein G7046_g9965 [Stylonectria norvegica]